jgi:signal transduction histidine kinase
MSRTKNFLLPAELGTSNIKSLQEIFPDRLRLTAAFAMALFALSNIPDIFMSEEIFWRLFSVKASAITLFGFLFLATWLASTITRCIILTYTQVITATIFTGIIIYMTGGEQSQWALGPGLIILVYCILVPLPARALTLISAISVLGHIIPAHILLTDSAASQFSSVHLFYFMAFIAIGITSGAVQYRLFIKQRLQLERSNELAEALRQSEENLKSKVSELEIARRKTADADRLKTEFLSNITHELRTPLTGIIGFSGLLTKDENIKDEAKEMIEAIQQEGGALLNLIENLIDLSKIEDFERGIWLEPDTVPLLIYQVVDSCKQEIDKAGHNVAVDVPKAFPAVMFDHYKLAQVLTHLMQNAIKFTSPGGEIEIGCRQNGKYVEIFVHDNGVGISQNEQKVIFDRFRQLDGSSTRQHGGTGIGLSIAKRFVELYKGSIEVKSEIGEGSTFVIKLEKKNE